VHSSLKSKISKPVQFEPIPKWVYDTNTLLPENRGKNIFFHHKTHTFKPGVWQNLVHPDDKEMVFKKSRSSKEQKIKMEGRIPHSWVRLTI
jgi:hypothetical protein